MVLLSIPPLAGRYYLRHHLSSPPLLVDLLRNLPRNLFLLGVVEIDTTAVLRAVVWSLEVQCCRIVHLIKELQKLRVVELSGVVNDLGGLGVCNNFKNALALLSVKLDVVPCLRGDARESDRVYSRPVLPVQTALYEGCFESPPMKPTLASYRPFPSNCLLYMCSTPQKHPAATVNFSAPSGIATADALILADVVKGWMRREKIEELAIRNKM